LGLFDLFGLFGSTGFFIGNATVGVESSGECLGVLADGFVGFWADVSLIGPGDQVPLDVPDDHGIRQRRRPSTVPRSPPPAAPAASVLSSLHCFATDAYWLINGIFEAGHFHS
jgi:hypothetical protein